MTLPPALQKSLEAEEVQVTPLQSAVWSEARAGADLLIEVRCEGTHHQKKKRRFGTAAHYSYACARPWPLR